MKRKNKGQTIMEYLVTYGWAIMIVIIVISAMYALGMFNVPTQETTIWCEQWCRNITKNLNYVQRQSTIEGNFCNCQVMTILPK